MYILVYTYKLYVLHFSLLFHQMGHVSTNAQHSHDYYVTSNLTALLALVGISLLVL